MAKKLTEIEMGLLKEIAAIKEGATLLKRARSVAQRLRDKGLVLETEGKWFLTHVGRERLAAL